MNKKIKITFKPVGDGCNLQCRHCYVAGSPRKIQVMDSRTMQNTFQKASEYSDKVRVLWHGGEPMLAGLDFWKEALEFQGSLPIRFVNVAQTNLTLADDDWAVFFRDNHIPVGTSYDGIPEIHDAYRVHADGHGSSEQVLAGIELLRSYGLADNMGVIACYTRFMQNRMLDVYEAMRDLGLGWKINFFIKSGHGEQQDDEIGTDPVDFARELCEVMDVYFFDSKSPEIETIDDYVSKLVRGRGYDKSRVHAGASCMDSQIAINGDGECYACGRFASEPEARIGNVNEDSFEAMFNSPFKDKIRRRSFETVAECRDCEYSRVCMSGCPQDAWSYYDRDICRPDHMCEANKMIYAHIVETVSKIKGVDYGSC